MGVSFGRGTLAARKHGARRLDPRPFAVGEIAGRSAFPIWTGGARHGLQRNYKTCG
jgi:hypothetical protein